MNRIASIAAIAFAVAAGSAFADDITLEYTPNLRQVENLELVW